MHRIEASKTERPSATNARVTVYGRPGRVQYTAPDGAIAVRLVGEMRIDLWSPCQVVRS